MLTEHVSASLLSAGPSSSRDLSGQHGSSMDCEHCREPRASELLDDLEDTRIVGGLPNYATCPSGARIHPQYMDEFKTGVSVVWHKVPWVLGCGGIWRDKERDHPIAARIDRRVVCAGEHISYLPAWQEGAILSSLDAISRLHDKVING